jgi:hypothetical protein
MQTGWRQFVQVFAASTSAALLLVAALIALIDPLAISPFRVVSNEILPQTNRRFIAPAIVRSGRFDGFIVGSSTVHSLDPKRVERVFPGRFANLSLYASTPHEQSQLVRLIVRERPDTRTIVWGLDTNWCNAGPIPRYSSEVFPEWLYRPLSWSYLTNTFNWASLELVFRKLRQLLQDKNMRLRPDGYVRALPPEGSYDLAKAQRAIYHTGQSPPLLEPELPAIPAGSPEAGAGLPGVVLLGDVLSKIRDGVTLVLVLMPRHAFALPVPGTPDAVRVRDCKAAIAALAQRRGHWVIDGMWRSPWTVDDNNYWDRSHFRDHLAEALIDGIDAAVNCGDVAPKAALRVLSKAIARSPAEACVRTFPTAVGSYGDQAYGLNASLPASASRHYPAADDLQ